MISKNKILIIVLILGIIILIIFITNWVFSSRIKYISKNIETNIDNCKIETDIDSHGGFLGDGEYFAKLKCTNNEDGEIEYKWKKLPLSIEIQKVMNLVKCDNGGCKTAYERFNISNVENGYYHFMDRHLDAIDSINEEGLNNRSSYNFSLGIYDINNKVLYYYELDT